MTVRAKRSFGQCFLVDRNICRIIAEEAATPSGGTTLEIGAGTGALTVELASRAAVVVAIERDRDLLPVLRDRFGGQDNVVLVEGDAATADWPALLQDRPRPHILAGNLPYQLTGRILQRAVELSHCFDRAVFMVQKEVAARLNAAPATKDYGALTVFVRSAFHPSLRVQVPSSCFRPRPKVDSSVVVLTPARGPDAARTPSFSLLVRRAFEQRRKTLRNAWSGVPGAERLAGAAGIDLDVRGETLRMEDFARAAALLEAEGQGEGR
jgi:16S rRNA (adenine1518-N6/adenine1519-N6)-dimethyltransferase